MRESPAKGFDDDALQLLKVFGIGEGPGHVHRRARMDLRLPEGRLRAQARRLHRQVSAVLRHDLPVALGIGEVPGRHLRHPAGRRSAHVLLQQEAAARGRLRRRLHRGAAGARADGRPHDGRADRHRQAGRRQDRRRVRHPAPPEQGPRLHHGVQFLRQQLRRRRTAISCSSATSSRRRSAGSSAA